MDGRPIILDHKVVITRWKMVHLHLCEVFALITDSNLLMSFVLINVDTHLVDSLGVLVDASIDATTHASEVKGQGKNHLLVRLLGGENTLVFGDVGGLDFHILPVVAVVNHIRNLFETHDE